MAPSVNSPLHPIVIPEIAVPPHFTCLGSGLLQNGHSRESAASLAALLLPSPAAPRGIANNSKPKTWWRAQCLHYGIDMPASANIERMRARLEEGLRSGKGGRGGEWGLVVPAELLDLEYAKCGEFRKLNAQVREAVSGAGGENAGKGKGKSKDKVEKGNDKLTKEPSKTSAKKKEPAPKKSIPAPAASEASTKKSKAKEQKELTVVTTTTITTTTTKNAKAGASRCGSGAGTLAPKAKSKPAERKQVVKGGGVSKSKASSPKKTAAVKKEIKKEDHSRSRSTPNRTQAEILRQQQEFLNSANFTSAQGPRPSYLSSSSIPSTYQAAAEPGQAPPRPRNIARCSRGKPGAAAGRGGLSARGRSSVSTNHNLPKPRAPRSTARRGNSSRGRGSAMTQGGVVGRPCEVEVDEPPPTYGSWMKDEEGGASDYSDGNTVRYQDSEGVGSENGNDATDFEEHEFYTDPDNALNEEEEEEEDDNDDGEGAYGRYYYGNPFRDQYPDHYSSEVNSDENSDEIGNSDAYAESLQSYHSEREEGEEGEEELQYSDTSGRQYDSESDMWENYAF